MDRITGQNYITVNGVRKFTEGPPATTIPADWLNAVQEEIMNAIAYAGITPNATTLTQLRDAIVNMIRNAGIYAVDIGAANDYVINPTPALASYTPGIAIWFQAAHANTGASTLNVSSLGQRTIKKNSTQDLVAGDILANQVVAVTFDGNYFQIANISLNLGGANGIATLDGNSKVVQEPTSKGAANGVASLNANTKVVQEPASKGAANGVASLDANTKVVQEPASKGAANGVASLDGNSKIVQEPASKGVANGMASLDANTKVVQEPASKGAANGVASLDENGLLVQAAKSLSDITNVIKIKIINIGDWNMDTLDFKTVVHGLNYANIRAVSGMIRSDTGALFYPLTPGPISSPTEVEAYIEAFDSMNITLRRKIGSIYFDNTSFDSTAYNRGWLTITYVE